MKFKHLNYTIKKSLSFFCVNPYSFDIIAVSETKISRKTSLNCNIKLKNYSFELSTTEFSAGGTLLYISNRLSYKPRFDLNILQKSSRIHVH